MPNWFFISYLDFGALDSMYLIENMEL